jgi:hypothetical protein
MKNITKLFAIATVVLGFASNSFSQNQSTASATASATIIGPIALTNTAPLLFGTIAPSAIAGTVTITPAGIGTGTNLTLTTMTATSAAAYSVTGNKSVTYAITLPANGTVKISNGTPAQDMNVRAFTCSSPLSTSLDASGSGNFTVGATLDVAGSQAAGTYTGTYDVTVAYN